MTNGFGYGAAIAMPFIALWMILEDIVYLCIAIALGISLGLSERKSEKKKRET